MHSSQATGDIVLPLSPGEVIEGRYELLKRVGKGGMGVVFEARHLELGRRVALKFVKVEHGHPEIAGRRLLREARLAGKLEHENVVATLDCGVSETRHYVVQEFVTGSTVGEVLGREGAFSVRRACDLVVQACRGLQHAHDAGVIHRDLKPENLMLTEHADGRDWLKILDFGIAFHLRPEGEVDATATGGPQGTAHYMAPEVASGYSKGDALSDIYALGVILFELLSAERPYEGDCYNSVIYNISTGKSRHLGRLRGDLPPALVDEVRRAMAFEPAQRHQSARGLLQALLPFSEHSNSPSVVTATARSARSLSPRFAHLVALSVLLVACYWLGVQAGTSKSASVFQHSMQSVEGEPSAAALFAAIPDAESAASENWMQAGEAEFPDDIPNDSSEAQRVRTSARELENRYHRDSASQVLVTPPPAAETNVPSSAVDANTGLDIRNPYQ